MAYPAPREERRAKILIGPPERRARIMHAVKMSPAIMSDKIDQASFLSFSTFM
jgi:hypothetical protein